MLSWSFPCPQPYGREARPNGQGQVARVVAGPDLFTRAREGGTRRLDRQRRRGSPESRSVSRELVHRGQIARVRRQGV